MAKRKTIASLENEIKNQAEQINAQEKTIADLRNVDYQNRNQISKMIFEKEFGHGRVTSTLEWYEIKTKISSIFERAIVRGEVDPVFERMNRGELARVWYIVRVMIGEKKVPEPMEIDRHESKFGDPSFNQP